MFYNYLRYFTVICLTIFVLSAESCSRFSKPAQETAPAASYQVEPFAILQTGRHPLWFQLTENGPILLESIEDAVNTTALAPWPLAMYMRFSQEKDGEIVSVVNRDGFMKFAVSETAKGIAMYYFSGGEFWRLYTVGGLIFYNDKPVALLYLDDRFLDSSAPNPNPRIWTFSMESVIPFQINIPALDIFSVEDGWSADILRYGSDGFWYYRVIKRSDSQPGIRILRTDNLLREGRDVTAEIFHSSAPQQTEIFNPSLPRLPNGFHYTWMGHVGDSIFASWEEQEEFYIGAAGFVVIKR